MTPTLPLILTLITMQGSKASPSRLHLPDRNLEASCGRRQAMRVREGTSCLPAHLHLHPALPSLPLLPRR